MSGWITERADAYCDSVRDGTHDSPKPVERGHRLITSKHIANETLNFAGANFISDEDYEAINQRSRVDVGDLLFSMIGTVGRVYRVDDEPDYAIKNMGLFKISDELKSKYLFYYMQSPTAKQYIEGCLAGSTQKFMSLTNLRAFPIVYPNDHTTMAAIVEILDSLTWKHRINQRTNDYLAATVNAGFNALIADETREVPLPQVIDVMSGGTPKTKESSYWNDGAIPFFGPGDVGSSTYVLETEKHITELGLENCNSSLYPKGTVFLTARGTVGKVAVAGKPMAMNQSCFALSGIDWVPQTYVYQVIKRAVKHLKAKANGATFAAINTRDLGDELIPIPSRKAVEAYDNWAEPLFSLMLANEEESFHLASLRNALLPKLMSGEIDVSKVELPTQLNNHLSV